MEIAHVCTRAPVTPCQQKLFKGKAEDHHLELTVGTASAFKNENETTLIRASLVVDIDLPKQT